MTSSTSNSKDIWVPSLGLAAVFVLGYAILAHSGKLPSGKGVSQYQQNWVTMEKFSADRMPQVQAVLCGSSMTQTLKPQLIDNRFYNMGVLGTSALTGLTIVNRSVNKPKVVFIEMGLPVANGVETAMIASIESPYHKWVAANAKFLRQDYQPSDILLSQFKKKNVGGADFPASADAIAGQVKRHTPLLVGAELTMMDRVFAGLHEEIDRAKANGVKVVLLEMRCSEAVEATAKMRAIWDRIQREFPESEYTWSKPLQPSDVITSDGIHLVPSVAARVSQALVDSLGR